MCPHFHIKDAQDPPLMWPCYLFHCCPLIGFSRASISRDPFYDMLATRKRRIANKKWRGTIFSMYNLRTPSIFISHTVNHTLQKLVHHRNDCQPQNRVRSWRQTSTELSANRAHLLGRHHTLLRGQQNSRKLRHVDLHGAAASLFLFHLIHTPYLPPLILIICF